MKVHETPPDRARRDIKYRGVVILLWIVAVAAGGLAYRNWREIFALRNKKDQTGEAAHREERKNGGLVHSSAPVLLDVSDRRAGPPGSRGQSGDVSSEQKAKDEMVRIVTEQNMMVVYGDLFRLLNLSPEQNRLLRDVIIKRSLIGDAFFAGHDEPSEWAEMDRAINAQIRPNLLTFLNEPETQIVEDYFETGWLRMWVNKVDDAIYSEGRILQPATRERIVTAMAQANPVRTLYPSLPSETLETLRSLLRPEEFTALNNVAIELKGRVQAFEEAKRTINKRENRGAP
jgi:hypothetical protein